jgi:hypothetical protein
MLSILKQWSSPFPRLVLGQDHRVVSGKVQVVLGQDQLRQVFQWVGGPIVGPTPSLQSVETLQPPDLAQNVPFDRTESVVSVFEEIDRGRESETVFA